MTPDPIVEAVREKLRSRSEFGMAKYGTNLMRSDLTRAQWLIHAQEETMDFALYLERLMTLENPMKLNVKRLTETAILPTRAHPGDAGLDLYADESIRIEDRALVSTGISVEIPLGYVGLIWPRSGLAARHGISVDAGVIDAGYRGPVKVLVTNSGCEFYTMVRGDKIAQLLIQPVALLDVVEVDSLDDTARGARGFGSTGA